MGVSLTILLLGQAIGWPSLYAQMRSCGQVSDYARSYADTMGHDHLKFAGAIGLVSWLPETFMSSMLQGSRILKRLHLLREAAAKELAYLDALPAAFG